MLRNLKRFLSDPKRYNQLYSHIRKYKCYRLMEIGTYDGEHALKMIKTAQRTYGSLGHIEYYGFDLFEDLDDATMAMEISKRPPPIDEVRNKLEATGAQITLFKGNTLQTLPENLWRFPLMDFIFIDGGHSVETIANDWKYAKELMFDKTVVIFDEYWNMDGGCKEIVDTIDLNKYSVRMLPPTDKFKKDWGILRINLVRIMKKC